MVLRSSELRSAETALTDAVALSLRASELSTTSRSGRKSRSGSSSTTSPSSWITGSEDLSTAACTLSCSRASTSSSVLPYSGADLGEHR